MFRFRFRCSCWSWIISVAGCYVCDLLFEKLSRGVLKKGLIPKPSDFYGMVGEGERVAVRCALGGTPFLISLERSSVNDDHVVRSNPTNR